MSHDYLSTACWHEFCDYCRVICKYCPKKCSCECHDLTTLPGDDGAMKTTAKVTLANKSTFQAGTDYEQVQLQFQADYADGKNKEWSVATPALSLHMTVKPSVAEQFETGGSYTLTFEKE